MAGVWNYESFPSIDEYAAFTHSLTYTDDEFPTAKYTVIVEANEKNPETVYINGNNISGYYTDVFDVSVKYKTKAVPNEYITVNNFRKIDIEKLEQVIEYKPDLTPYKDYTYTATVYEVVNKQNILVDTKQLTKKVNNNWDLNRELLLRYVSNTAVVDEALFKQWINSINESAVKWKNTSNVVINWT